MPRSAYWQVCSALFVCLDESQRVACHSPEPAHAPTNSLNRLARLGRCWDPGCAPPIVHPFAQFLADLEEGQTLGLDRLGLLIPCVSFECPTTVTQSGDLSQGHALAQAGDGTLWLATVRDHVDRTATYENSTGPGDACQCWGNCGGNFAPKDDLSSSTLAIQRIPSGATAPSGILWSLDLGLRPWAYYSVTNETMSASFAGSLLFLAILAPDKDVHYLVLDTANLFGS